jgi:hypothetical protein
VIAPWWLGSVAAVLAIGLLMYLASESLIGWCMRDSEHGRASFKLWPLGPRCAYEDGTSSEPSWLLTVAVIELVVCGAAAVRRSRRSAVLHRRPFDRRSPHRTVPAFGCGAGPRSASFSDVE